MLQASDGYLWLATENGVARFDGVRFERFGAETNPAFASNDACCLASTADGAIWIGTSDGLLHVRGGRFVRVRDVGAVLGVTADGHDTVAVLTATGLLRAREDNVHPVTLPGNAEVTAIGAGRSGTVLIAAGARLYRSTAGHLQEEKSLSAPPLDLLEDATGQIWFRTAAEVVARSDTAERHWARGRDLPGTRLQSLNLTQEGVVVGTNRGAFLIRHDPQLAKTDVQAVPEMAGTSVLSATVDAEGDQWFGTDSSGIAMLRRRAMGSVVDLQSEAVTAVVSTLDGTHWVGTRDSGLRTVIHGRVVTPAVNAKLSSQVILALAPDARNGLWVGTPEGLDHVQGSQLVHYSAADGLPDDLVRSVLAEADGSVWVGTRRGLAHLKAGQVNQVLSRTDGLPSDVIGTMLRTRNGDLWIGTLDGLARLHGTALERIAVTAGLGSRAVTALAELLDGSVVVGTRGSGLSVITPANLLAAQAVRSPRLPSTIDTLVLDLEGSLWIRDPLGVAKVSADALERCAGTEVCPLAVRSYGTADGMPSVDTSSDGHPAAWRDRRGALWFATRRGVATVDPAQLPVDAVPPTTVIQRFLVNSADQVVPPSSGEVRLPAQSRRFVIEYAGISFAAPSQVTYRFRLEGFDRDWIEAGNRRNAEYTNLPAGHYRFMVDARNADGVASARPAELAFQVAAPLYRRWWFYLVVLAVAGMLTYGIYRLRLKRVQREFAAVLQERTRIAREIHDTLAQDFVAVSLQLEVTAQLLRANATEAAQEQVNAARELVREGIREARESIWALRANTSSDSLPARLSALVQRTDASPATAQCSVKGAYRVLPAATEQELIRVAKEALGNAIRHANARRISVHLHYSEDAVELSVRDDGRGFALAEGTARAGHYGLRGMRERAVAVGGHLSLESEPGQGSTVTFVVHSRQGKG